MVAARVRGAEVAKAKVKGAAVVAVRAAVRDVVRIVDTQIASGSVHDKASEHVSQRTLQDPKRKQGGIIMPGFDRSGPMGTGSMTGGRRGLCGGAYGRPNAVGEGYDRGRGVGQRRGYGRGRCFGYAGYGGYPYPHAFGPANPVGRADEMAMLRAEANAMKASLESVQNRIAEMEKETSE